MTVRNQISRRDFLKGSAAAAAIAAFAPFMKGTAFADEEKTTTIDYASKVTETVETDIVVLGAGMSGLTAAVEALNNGAKVLVLESQPRAGGNGQVTSCVMAVESRIQKKLGIEVTPAQIIETEMETFNYSVDGVRWSRLIKDSADNIEWLIDQGCLMMDDFVDNYHGMGVVNTAHWWIGETARDGGPGFIVPMVARVEELGGEIRYQSAGKQLIQNDKGAVVGVYAETEDGVLQVNAKAVIIATGGYANNNDFLTEIGYDPANTAIFGMPGHNGDGIAMALNAGGKSWLQNSSLMEYPMNPKIGQASSFLSENPASLWVNGKGLRFVNENCAEMVPARAALAVRSQEISYALLDQTLLERLTDGNETNAKVVEDGVANGAIYKADSIEELAALAGMDAGTLRETVDTYNAACKAGEDREFGKKAELMIPLEKGPFYLSENSGVFFLTTIGGIDTTPDCEVRSIKGGVVENLYAVGVDGVENYKGLYTIDIPGSCNANNIWSGRHAAQMACAKL